MPIGTSNYPAALDTATELIRAVNDARSEIGAAGLTIGATTIPVVSASSAPADGLAMIATFDGDGNLDDYEFVTFAGKTATTLTGVTRGFGGSGDSAWPAGTAIFFDIIGSFHHTVLAQAIIAIETLLGANGENVGGSPGGTDGQIQYNNGGAFGGFGLYDDATGDLELSAANSVRLQGGTSELSVEDSWGGISAYASGMIFTSEGPSEFTALTGHFKFAGQYLRFTDSDVGNNADIVGDALTVDRMYALPDASGEFVVSGAVGPTTISTTEGDLVFSAGDRLNFTSGVWTGRGISFTSGAEIVFYAAGLGNIEFLANGFFVISSNGGISNAWLDPGYLTANRTYAFPDGSGFLSIKVDPPASATADGVEGMWAEDDSFLYICTAPATWRRVAIASW